MIYVDKEIRLLVLGFIGDVVIPYCQCHSGFSETNKISNNGIRGFPLRIESIRLAWQRSLLEVNRVLDLMNKLSTRVYRL